MVFNFPPTDATPPQRILVTAPRGRRWRREPGGAATQGRWQRRHAPGSPGDGLGDGLGDHADGGAGPLRVAPRALRTRTRRCRPQRRPAELAVEGPTRRLAGIPASLVEVRRRGRLASPAARTSPRRARRRSHRRRRGLPQASRRLPSITDALARDRARPAPVSPARPRVLRPRRRLSRSPRLRRAPPAARELLGLWAGLQWALPAINCSRCRID